MADKPVDLSGYGLQERVYWAGLLNNYHWPHGFPIKEPAGWHLLTQDEKHQHPEMHRAACAILRSVSLDTIRKYDGMFIAKGLMAKFGTPREETWRDRPPLL